MTDSEHAAQHRSTYRRLIGYALQHWPVFLLAIVGMIFVALSQPAFAWLMKPMLDGGFIQKDPEVMSWIPLAVIAVFIVRAVAGFVSDFGMAWIGRHVIMDMRTEMFDKLMRLPNSYFDFNSTGNTISKFTFDAEQLAQASTTAITILIKDVLMVISLIGYMFFISPVLAGVFLIVGPVIVFLIAFVAKRFRTISKRIQQSMGKITHVLEEAVQGQRVVKIFGGQRYEIDRFNDTSNRNRQQNIKLIATSSLSTSIIQFIVSLALAGIIYAAIQQGMQSNISTGSFVSFMAAMLMLFAPLKHLTGINSVIQRGIAAAESVFELIDSRVENDTGDFESSRVQGEIHFDHVNFSYRGSEEKNVLQDIDLNIQPGQTVAFVGRSGSGKSTLVNLLPRLYDYFEGRILLDGRDIREYTLDSLRQQIAYVGQEIVLFNDTVAHNIAYGSLQDVDEQDIIAAAKSAHADEFIDRMSEGLQTMVGEKGVMLSGGQRQRVAIARALLKNAPVLIMDEATSALDTESERHIQAALEELLKNRTTLVIAHRLSTIENADLIVVMSEGRIVETGNHQQLLQQDGHYASLHRLQFSDAAIDPAHETS